MGDDGRPHCSFCGKTQDDVAKLIAGPKAYICDECVDLSYEILMHDDASPRWRMRLALHSWKTSLRATWRVLTWWTSQPGPRQVTPP